MTHPERDAGLDRAAAHARTWLASLDHRPVPAQQTADQVADALGRKFPSDPMPPEEVVDLLVRACEPGLTALPSGRFFGFVIGGSHPAAIAADWLTTVWDQNAGLRALTPASAALEEVAGAWILEALSLPSESAVGYVTGGTTANFTCLATGRDAVLRTAGYDVRRGLAALPPVQVVAGADRHASIDLAARYLGLATPESVPVDDQGRIRPEDLERVLAGRSGFTIVALQAGNIHSGAFDPFPACIEIARRHGAWIHVDGAFGLWAAASPSFEHLTVGLAGADSWATDAHKTLNVPYDCGLAIVRDREAMATSMAMHGDYLIESPVGDPQERVPELSRRARGAPVWAVLRSLGRSGLTDLVDQLAGHARAFAAAVDRMPGATVVNDVVFTQACIAFADDATTQRVTELLLDDGTVWMSGSRWRGRAVLRVSVSNWSTTDEDVDRSVAALERVASSVVTA